MNKRRRKKAEDPVGKLVRIIAKHLSKLPPLEREARIRAGAEFLEQRRNERSRP